MAIIIEVNDADIRAAFNRLLATVENPEAAMKVVGETWLANTKRRFDTETGPDGVRWQANSALTLQRFLGYRKSNFGKKGGLSAKGMARIGAKKILQGHSGDLRNTLFFDAGPDFVLLASPMIYSATQQFGAAQGKFGTDSRNHPIPWGDIPARPFLGASEEDKADILGIFNDFLSRAIDGG